MSHKEFRRWLLRDLAVYVVLMAALGTAMALGPEWVTGAIVLGVLPMTVVSIFIFAAAASRRRDADPSPKGADPARPAPSTLPATALVSTAGPASLPGPAARPYVVTAWTEAAWATHFRSLHSYRVTRPGR